MTWPQLLRRESIIRKSFLRGLGGVLVLLVSGCAVKPPDFSRNQLASLAGGDFLGGGWTAAPEARKGVDDDWIRLYGGRPLVGLVEEALARNPDLRGSAERVMRAQSLVRVASATWRPVLSASANAARSKQRYFGTLTSTSTSFGLSLDASWELDVWGRIRAAGSQAIGDWQAAAYDQEAAKLSLAAQVAKSWFALGEANEQVKFAMASLELARQSEQSIRDRFEVGLSDERGTAGQLHLTESDVANAEAELARWRGMTDIARRQLELLLGRYPAGRLRGAGLPKVAWGFPPAGLRSELLLRRPDLLAAERRYAASGKASEAARLARYPSLTLTGGVGTSTDTLRNVIKSDFGVWSIGAGLVQPILNGRKLTEQWRQAQSSERQALFTLHSTVLSAFSEVEQALSKERALRAEITALEKASKSANAAYKASELDYRDGLETLLTVLETRNRQVTIGSRLVSLRRQHLDNRINLHLALGGSWKAR